MSWDCEKFPHDVEISENVLKAWDERTVDDLGVAACSGSGFLHLERIAAYLQTTASRVS
jgi:hypothetical protein